MGPKILIVDDDPDFVMMVQDWLGSQGYETVVAGDGEEGLQAIDHHLPGVVLLDLQLPAVPGLDVLKAIAERRQSDPERWDVPVIVMTAFGTIPRAVEAMKQGAYDFLTKPFDFEHLTIVVRKALERESLKRQVACLRLDVESRYAAIVGTSETMKNVMDLAQRAARSDASVLLLGESGTGKELFARSIHAWSPRRAMPFVVINCVALSDTLLESELFGHEKGAFTGAVNQKKGLFELAHGGTVFLDEIGDMKPELQAKLLRVLQDNEFERVGGTQPVKVDIRVIAATNQDLAEAVKAGRFRKDLFFRLNVVALLLPPLRERREDIGMLAQCFLDRYARETKRPNMKFEPSTMEALLAYDWPGNVRELENVIERAVVLAPERTIRPKDVLSGITLSPSPRGGDTLELPFHESVEVHKRALIRHAIERAGGSKTGAARLLGLQPTYLSRLCRQLGIT